MERIVALIFHFFFEDHLVREVHGIAIVAPITIEQPDASKRTVWHILKTENKRI
jgi:hypothetical protein